MIGALKRQMLFFGCCHQIALRFLLLYLQNSQIAPKVQSKAAKRIEKIKKDLYPDAIQESSILGMYEESKHDFDYYKRKREFKQNRRKIREMKINAISQ